MGMSDFDFSVIAPRCGGRGDALEELCRQLAHRTFTQRSDYSKLRGVGSDGGVECFVDFLMAV